MARAPTKRKTTTSGKRGSKPAAEFLILLIPDDAQPGSNMRLLDVKGSQSAAENAVAKLDSNVLGRVAVVERKKLYTRQQQVESVVVDDRIKKN